LALVVPGVESERSSAGQDGVWRIGVLVRF